jgi:hypothetical protein
MYDYFHARRPPFLADEAEERSKAELGSGKVKKAAARNRGKEKGTGLPLFCVCRTVHDPVEAYIACDSCEDWFHLRCIKGMSHFAAKYIVLSFACADCSREVGAECHLRADADPVVIDAWDAFKAMPGVAAEQRSAYSGAWEGPKLEPPKGEGGGGALSATSTTSSFSLPENAVKVFPPSGASLTASLRPLGVLLVAPTPQPGPCGVVLRLRHAQSAEDLLKQQGSKQGGGRDGDAADALAAEGGRGASSSLPTPRAIVSLPAHGAGSRQQWWDVALGRPLVEGQREKTLFEEAQEDKKLSSGRMRLVLKS